MLFRSPAVTYQKLLFAPSAPVPLDVIPMLDQLATTDEAINYTKLSVYQEREEEDMLPDPVVPNVAPEPVAAPVQSDVVAEPTLRESTVQPPPPPKADVNSIINKWSVKS